MSCSAVYFRGEACAICADISPQQRYIHLYMHTRNQGESPVGWVTKSRRWWPCMGLAAADSIVVLYTTQHPDTTVDETNVWLEVRVSCAKKHW